MACLNGVNELLRTMTCNHNPRPQKPDLAFIYLTDFCSYSFQIRDADKAHSLYLTDISEHL